MRETLKNLCLSTLFYILDVKGTEVEEDDKEVIAWLSRSSNDIGFIRYIQMRERNIIRAMLSSGLGKEPRDTFQRESGQRFENQSLLRRATRARQITEHKLEERKKKSVVPSDN